MTQQDIEQFVRTYDRAVFRLRAGGRTAPSRERFEAFERTIDFEFPEEFRVFSVSPLACLCYEVCQDLWPRPTSYGGRDDVGSLFSVNVFGIAAGVPERLDLRDELGKLPPEECDIVPFMSRGIEPHRYCFDLDGAIVLWHADDGSRMPLDLDFPSLLLSEFEALAARRLTLWGKKQKKRSSAAGSKSRRPRR